MTPLTDGRAVGQFLQSLGRSLADAAGATRDGDAATGIRRLGQIAQSVAPKVSPTSASTLPVCRFWNDAIVSAKRAGSPLAAIVDALAPAFSWTQNPNYRRDPPDPGFLDRYGYAVIAGPPDGPSALANDPKVAIGVLLLGPNTHYPLHSHPAVEVYYTLTEEGEWWRDNGPWQSKPAGSAIYHAPNVPHATRAQAAPMLAVYLWIGDLKTHASLHS